MISASGIIKVDKEQSRIVVDVSPDILDYYHWHLSRAFWIKLQKPLYGGHITIYNKKFHKQVNWQRAIYYDGEKIDFQYDPYVIQGGYTKGFIMFYLKVYSEQLDNMKKDINIVENENWRGHHITLANGKNNNVRSFWPEMITIK